MLLREEEGKRSGAAAVKLEGEAPPLDDVEVEVCNQVGSGTGILPFFRLNRSPQFLFSLCCVLFRQSMGSALQR